MRGRNKLLVIAAALALLAPATAQASSSQVIQDCAADGQLDGHYSNGDLRAAERNLPSDLNEYSDCRDVIRGAIVSGPGQGGGSGGGSRGSDGGSSSRSGHRSAASDRDKKALAAATDGGASDVRVGDRRVKPGENGVFDVASAAHGLPLPLLLALIAIGLLALAGSALALRGRFPALANIAARGPFGRFRR